MVRTPYCDKSGLRKGTWTPEEDRKLVAYVTRYGCWNWRQLPKYAGLSRCGKSCRLRWMNYLRPNVKRGNYTREEEETIISLHESLGNRWAAIAAKLPGRTDNEIKNHWHTNLKKRVKQNSAAKEVKQRPSSDDISGLETTSKEGMSSENILQSPAEPHLVNDSSSSNSSSSFGSTLSPQQSYSSFSSMIKDTNYTDTITSPDLMSNDDGFGFLEAYQAPCGDFWTEPFLADNFYDPSLPSFEILTSFVDIHSQFPDGEILGAYGLY
ncbi:hypothetical protein K2173_018658 [Erythroxylum novogranatense]|uniref:Uncharacterized protein n=1 Tax=Erythroxylum novogranatense TaxID=1862640 RepID=A0AAV8SAF5_9ROSI|nr:hypothetical protein K2173_018658 [Erythroxylum novogranatense]